MGNEIATFSIKNNMWENTPPQRAGMFWNQAHHSHFWWPIIGPPVNQKDSYRFYPWCNPLRKSCTDLGRDYTGATLSRESQCFLVPIQSDAHQTLFEAKWRHQQFYADKSHPTWTRTGLSCWDALVQDQYDALPTLDTSFLWPYRQWIFLDKLFASTIWHTTQWSFVDAVLRIHIWGFFVSNGASFP